MFLVISTVVIIWVCFWIAACLELREGLKEIRAEQVLAGQVNLRLSFSIWHVVGLFFIWPFWYS